MIAIRFLQFETFEEAMAAMEKRPKCEYPYVGFELPDGSQWARTLPTREWVQINPDIHWPKVLPAEPR